MGGGWGGEIKESPFSAQFFSLLCGWCMGLFSLRKCLNNLQFQSFFVVMIFIILNKISPVPI